LQEAEASVKLTKALIEKSQYPAGHKGRFVIWDDELTSFGLRIYPSGKRSFILSYRLHRRKHLFTLGIYGRLTLEEARKSAKIRMGDIAKGEDPLIFRKRIANLGTISELCEKYLADYAVPHKKTWRDDERMINNDILPAIGSFPLKGLTVSDVSALHRKVGERSIYVANRTLEVLSCAIEKGRDWGFIEYAALNPAKKVEHFREKKRDRWLTPEELPRVASAIADEENIYIRAAFWLYLFTGVRKSELLRAKWADIDVFRNELRLEETKNGKTHYVPLSSAAMELIRSIPKQTDNPYIFPGIGKQGHLVAITYAWHRIRKTAGVEDVRLHDLRRTVGSMLAQSGSSLHLIGRVLNHSSTEATKVYARFGQDSVRNALEGHATQLLEASRYSTLEVPKLTER
jgi:integrase